MGSGMTYTDEMRQFILDNYKGIYAKELAERFNHEFGTDVTAAMMKSYKARYGLNSGLTGHYLKGQVPHNKGKKMTPEVYEKCKGTMFKRGQAPVNYRPVGSERINVDGYIEVKVKDPRTWKLKHNIIWEQNFGKIPKGYVVVFLDQDKLNTNIENLKLVSRRDLLVVNRYHLATNDSGELNDAAFNLAKLMNDTKMRRDSCEQKERYHKSNQ